MSAYRDSWLEVHRGDCRAVLQTLPAESVNCVVTSPPYWGLRDYGTAAWDGGDPDCGHRHDTQHQKQGVTSQRLGRSNADEQRNENFRDRCGKCGAVRQDRQIGLEATPEEYVATLVDVFREIRRVLRDDGTAWLNLGDSYAGGKSSAGDGMAALGVRYRGGGLKASATEKPERQKPADLKPKDLVGIPWRVAFALQADGWYLRSDIIWAKPNPMPESVTDRPTKSHEYLFLLAKQPRYWYDADAVREGRTDSNFSRAEAIDRHGTTDGIHASAAKLPGSPYHAHKGARRGLPGVGTTFVADPAGRNLRSVWTVATQPYAGAHFATFPPKLIEPCILAGCPENGVVLDPFAGTGTAGLVANKLSRRAVLIDLNGEYIEQLQKRNAQTPLGLAG